MTKYLGGAAAAALMIALGAPTLARSGAQDPVRYDLSFDNAVHHEARITATWTGVPAGPLRVQMSRSSPGRYAIHEFAKNVYSVSAVDGAGRALKVGRSDPYGWTVEGHDGTVAVSYTLFGDRADGTYAQIDASHAHLNMPATLMWAHGYDARPVEVRFQPQAGWTIATQLEPAGDGVTFRAPNLQYLMDSPAELSDHATREWSIDDDGTARTIRLTVHHNGSDADLDTFAEKAKKVVAAHIAIWGDTPDFDFGTYTFLADYMPQVAGDGMEHRNSTVIIQPRSFQAANFAQLDTLSHEFFHAWNVERLRPAELEPFDFTRANPTPSLWFAEGFTEYYGPLAIRRAGECSVDDYLRELAATLNEVVNSPARAYGSPQEMSLRAPFVDAATTIDPTNPNVFVSYYPYGAVIALALDLSLRAEFDLTLDDYMRQMWRTHGVTERPYRPEDLKTGLAELTGNRAFADAFFARSVEASELPDFAPLLQRAGLVLRAARPERAWAGNGTLQSVAGTTRLRLGGSPAPGTPLYEAGLDRGDEIVSVGGMAIAAPADWDRAVESARPGEETEIRFVSRGDERTARLRWAVDPTLEIIRAEASGGSLAGAQRAFREAWLGGE